MESVVIILVAFTVLAWYAIKGNSDKQEIAKRKADAMVDILKSVQSHITIESSTGLSNYTSAKELIDELTADIAEIQNGKIQLLKKYKIKFAPTGTFQEIAMANNWHDDYMKLADEFDAIYG